MLLQSTTGSGIVPQLPLNEVQSQDRVAAPRRRAREPIMDVAVEAPPNIQCPIMMPIRVSGTGVRIMSGSSNEPNCPTTTK